MSTPVGHHRVPAEKLQLGVDLENLVDVSIRSKRSALVVVFEVREITIHTWLCRSEMQGKKLHERFLVDWQIKINDGSSTS
jgi:hypothetical protein